MRVGRQQVAQTLHSHLSKPFIACVVCVVSLSDKNHVVTLLNCQTLILLYEGVQRLEVLLVRRQQFYKENEVSSKKLYIRHSVGCSVTLFKVSHLLNVFGHFDALLGICKFTNAISRNDVLKDSQQRSYETRSTFRTTIVVIVLFIKSRPAASRLIIGSKCEHPL